MNFAKFLRTPFSEHLWATTSDMLRVLHIGQKIFLKKFNLFFRQKRRSGKPIRKNWTQK